MDDAGSWLKQAEYSTYFNPEGFDAAKRVVRMPHKWGQWQERVAYVHQSIYPSIHPSTHPCTIISISPIKIEQVSYHSFRFGFYVYIYRCISPSYIYIYVHDFTNLYPFGGPQILPWFCVRNVRKCMERARGLSFVRGTLAEEPLSETNWVKMLGATGCNGVQRGYAMGWKPGGL